MNVDEIHEEIDQQILKVIKSQSELEDHKVLNIIMWIRRGMANPAWVLRRIGELREHHV